MHCTPICTSHCLGGHYIVPELCRALQCVFGGCCIAPQIMQGNCVVPQVMQDISWVGGHCIASQGAQCTACMFGGVALHPELCRALRGLAGGLTLLPGCVGVGVAVMLQEGTWATLYTVLGGGGEQRTWSSSTAKEGAGWGISKSTGSSLIPVQERERVEGKERRRGKDEKGRTERRQEGQKDAILLGTAVFCSSGGLLPRGLGSHIPSKGAKHPWGCCGGHTGDMGTATGGVLLGAMLSLGWGGRHAPSSPISLSWLGRPRGCNLGVVSTSGIFKLKEKTTWFHLN